MNKNVIIAFVIFMLFFIYCQVFGEENWRPRMYLKDIRNSIIDSVKDPKVIEVPADDVVVFDEPRFNSFDKGNRFANLDEVDSMHKSAKKAGQKLHINIDSEAQHYLDQHMRLLNRGGNAD